MLFNAASVNLSHFDCVIAHYDPKDIHAQAIQATEENIGQLALEFELDLILSRNDGHQKGYFFSFNAERGVGTDPEPARCTQVFVTNWIVALWGELHVYTDDLFHKTFRIEFPVEEVKLIGEASINGPWAENDFGPGGRGLFNPIPKALADAVQKMDEQRKNEPTYVPDTTQIIPAFGKVDVEDQVIESVKDREKILEHQRLMSERAAGNDRPQSL